MLSTITLRLASTQHLVSTAAELTGSDLRSALLSLFCFTWDPPSTFRRAAEDAAEVLRNPSEAHYRLYEELKEEAGIFGDTFITDPEMMKAERSAERETRSFKGAAPQPSFGRMDTPYAHEASQMAQGHASPLAPQPPASASEAGAPPAGEKAVYGRAMRQERTTGPSGGVSDVMEGDTQGEKQPPSRSDMESEHLRASGYPTAAKESPPKQPLDKTKSTMHDKLPEMAWHDDKVGTAGSDVKGEGAGVILLNQCRQCWAH